MTKTVSQGEIQTKPLSITGKAPGVAIHAIPHVHWEREWDEPFEVQRAKFLNLLIHLQAQLDDLTKANGNGNGSQQAPIKFLLMSGQTVILEDLAAIRPELLGRLITYNVHNRVTLGPWYIHVDEMLVSGESLIRNLLMAAADAIRYNLKLMPISYQTHQGMHIAQMPQILANFDIDIAFMKQISPVPQLPFRWEAPNGRSILVVDYQSTDPDQGDVASHITQVNEFIDMQKAIRPDGPFLWLVDTTNPNAVAHTGAKITQKTQSPVNLSTLLGFSRALRKELPDHLRPSLSGELNPAKTQKNTPNLSGRFSARVAIKQANARVENYMVRVAEPLMAIALTHGKTPYVNNLRALLNHCWRTLLKTQSYNALAGTAHDDVHQENMVKYRRIENTAKQIVHDSLAALGGELHKNGVHPKTDKTYFTLWNPLNWPARDVVEMPLDLPSGKYPGKLLSPLGEEIPFAWKPGKTHSKLEFLAEVKGVGYSTYTLIFSDTPPAKGHAVHRYAGTSISHAGEAAYVQDGKLTWQYNNTVIEDLLRYYDGGDAGDLYTYCPPENDNIEQATLVNDTQVEISPFYQRLILHHRMRVAPELTPERERQRGTKRMDIQTIVTLYHHKPGLYFRTRFINGVKDHRLRAHLRTDIVNNKVMADSAFAITEREIQYPVEDTAKTVHTQPTQGLVAVTDQERTMAAVTRGLVEYEPIAEDDQVTLALTLVRAVGWLSRDDLKTRPGAIAPMIPTPDAQCQHEIDVEYALIETLPDDGAALLQARETFNTPLQVFQYDAPPELPRRSFLSVVSDRAIGAHSDGDGAILTSLKAPQMGKGWITRFYNPHNQPVELLVTPHQRPDTAQRIAMSEYDTLDSYLEIDANGRVTVQLAPYEIVTVRLGFNRDE